MKLKTRTQRLESHVRQSIPADTRDPELVQALQGFFKDFPLSAIPRGVSLKDYQAKMLNPFLDSCMGSSLPVAK